MTSKTRVLSWGLVALLVVLVGMVLVLNADAQSSAYISLKAKFISGYTLDVRDPQGIAIPNRIVNDDPAAYYENVRGNDILLRDGGALVLSIVTSGKSPRYVNISFDWEVSAPGQNLPSSCVMPNFIYPVVIAPIATTKFRMISEGEWQMTPDPNDPGMPILEAKDNNLNFAAMTDGQEAYVYLTWLYFYPSDLKTTRYNESRDCYCFADCLWAKVKAWDWDGEKVNTWTVTPVTEPFKHKAWDNPNAWCCHPEGAIPYMLFSNYRLSCNHGTYRMPWELEITRR